MATLLKVRGLTSNPAGGTSPRGFRLPTAARATLSTNLAGTNNDITYTAVKAGAAGNDIRVRYVVAGLSTALSVSVSGNDITVNSATNGAGAATSTGDDVKAAIEADASAAALVTVADKTGNDGSGVIAALAFTNLAGGSDAGVPATVKDGTTVVVDLDNATVRQALRRNSGRYVSLGLQ